MLGKHIAYSTQYNEESASTIMSVQELAEYLDIGKNRAYELLRTHTIKGFRIGNSWKVTREAVEQYIMQESGFL